MPPVVVAAAQLAAAAAGAILAAAPAALTKIGISLVLSGLQAALGSKAASRTRSRGARLSRNAFERTLNIRQPILERNIVYGMVRIGGGLVYQKERSK